jgi:ABC-type polar amino acid transport system ATPase subunit
MSMNDISTEAPVLIVEGLSKRFNNVLALDEVSFELKRGEAVGIIGPSGSGKSTLLRCLDLLVPLTVGTLTYALPNRIQARATETEAAISALDGSPVSATMVRRSIGFVFQRLHLWRERTVLENLTLGPRVVLGISTTAAEAKARTLAERFAISDRLDARIWQLSGGQQQRAAIARALMMDPQLLLLDEVTSALDPILTAAVMDIILTLRANAMTMLIVTHHIEFAARICDRLIFLDNGRILQTGSPDELLSSPRTPAIARFLEVLKRVR